MLKDKRILLEDTPELSSIQTIKIVHKNPIILYSKQLRVTDGRSMKKQVNPYVYNQLEIKKF
jgi:hypothetical protein